MHGLHVKSNVPTVWADANRRACFFYESCTQHWHNIESSNIFGNHAPSSGRGSAQRAPSEAAPGVFFHIFWKLIPRSKCFKKCPSIFFRIIVCFLLCQKTTFIGGRKLPAKLWKWRQICCFCADHTRAIEQALETTEWVLDHGSWLWNIFLGLTRKILRIARQGWFHIGF